MVSCLETLEWIRCTNDYAAYECVTCNGAMSELERHALGFMFTMATITFVSFTWFAGGFGVFST